MRTDKHQAESAYLTASAERSRLAMTGGATKTTAIIRDNMGGHYLEFEMWALKNMKQHGWRTDGPGTVTVTARSWSRNKIRLTACEDASKVKLLDKRGREVRKQRPRRFVQTLTATKVDGRWKITDLESNVVKTFANEPRCRR